MASIPVSLVPEAEDPLSIQVIADGRIGGDDIQFVVDTGARTSLVPLVPATSELLSARRSAAIGAAGTAADDDEVTVPELCVGELVARDVTADRADLEATRRPLLGINVLSRHSCFFRLAEGTIDLDAPPPAGLDVRPLDPDPSGIPFVTVDFAATASPTNSISVRACWDTGAGRSVVDLAWAERHRELVAIGNLIPGRDSAGIEIEAWAGELAACSIGGVQFEPSACVAIDLSALNAHFEQPIEVIVGVPIIQAANWWFDFPGQQWGACPTVR